MPLHAADKFLELLKANAGKLAAKLLDGPGVRRGSSIRWGTNGSLKLELVGSYAGMFYDFEAEQNFGIIDLIQKRLGCDRKSAILWARDELGLSSIEPIDIRSPTYSPLSVTACDSSSKYSARRGTQFGVKSDFTSIRSNDEKYAEALVISNCSVPIDGTPAERYLTAGRGILKPLNGWPEAAIRWHQESMSLVAISRGSSEVVGIQRIFLTNEGCRISETAKFSLGTIGRGKVHLPEFLTDFSDNRLIREMGRDTIVLHAEGLETGLSIWSATGIHTQVGLGRNFDFQSGALNVLAMDDDERINHRGDRVYIAMEKIIRSALNTATIHLAVATPWASRRYDKTDFNDLIMKCGPEAVRVRILDAIGKHRHGISFIPELPGTLLENIVVDLPPKGAYQTGAAFEAGLQRVGDDGRFIVPCGMDLLKQCRWISARGMRAALPKTLNPAEAAIGLSAAIDKVKLDKPKWILEEALYKAAAERRIM